MSTIAISYDLSKPGQAYSSLHQSIKSISGYWAKVSESFWIVKTSKSAAAVRDELRKHFDANDVLFVSEFDNWASLYLPSNIVEWLKQSYAA